MLYDDEFSVSVAVGLEDDVVLFGQAGHHHSRVYEDRASNRASAMTSPSLLLVDDLADRTPHQLYHRPNSVSMIVTRLRSLQTRTPEAVVLFARRWRMVSTTYRTRWVRDHAQTHNGICVCAVVA